MAGLSNTGQVYRDFIGRDSASLGIRGKLDSLARLYRELTELEILEHGNEFRETYLHRACQRLSVRVKHISSDLDGGLPEVMDGFEEALTRRFGKERALGIHTAYSSQMEDARRRLSNL